MTKVGTDCDVPEFEVYSFIDVPVMFTSVTFRVPLKAFVAALTTFDKV